MAVAFWLTRDEVSIALIVGVNVCVGFWIGRWPALALAPLALIPLAIVGADEIATWYVLVWIGTACIALLAAGVVARKLLDGRRKAWRAGQVKATEHRRQPGLDS